MAPAVNPGPAVGEVGMNEEGPKAVRRLWQYWFYVAMYV